MGSTLPCRGPLGRCMPPRRHLFIRCLLILPGPRPPPTTCPKQPFLPLCIA